MVIDTRRIKAILGRAYRISVDDFIAGLDIIEDAIRNHDFTDQRRQAALLLVHGASMEELENMLSIKPVYARWLAGDIYKELRFVLYPLLDRLNVEKISPNDVKSKVDIFGLSYILALTQPGARSVLARAAEDLGITIEDSHKIIIDRATAKRIVDWYVTSYSGDEDGVDMDDKGRENILIGKQVQVGQDS